MKNIFHLLILVPVLLSAQNLQGPFNPTLAQNTSCPFSYSSTIDYLPAENVFASDDEYATASHCDCCDANTRCLQVSGYGFAIPLTATIDGIVAEVEKKASPGSIIQDNGVRLLKANEVTGNNYATAVNWPLADTYITYGGTGDLWGDTWLPSDISDDGFGLAFATISYTCNGNNIPAVTYIDHIRISVYFTDVATGTSSVVSSDDSHMIIAPNPSNSGDVLFSFPPGEKNIHLIITDPTGRIVEDKVVDVVGGKVRYTSSLSPGIYVLSAKGGSNVYVQKMVVE